MSGCLWFFVVIIALGSAIAFPPLLFVVAIVLPLVMFFKYMKRKGW